jgi:adenylate kinase family enzyme
VEIYEVQVKRIAVTGPSGAGKSRLARELGNAFAIQVLHLDTLVWKPGWVRTPRADFEELQRRELERESWIVDAQPESMLPDWFEAADTIIFVDASPLQCLWRAGRRRLAREAGPHVPAGSKPGPLHRSLLKFVHWQWGYRRKVRPWLLTELEARRERQRVVVLRGRTDAWLGLLLSGNSS